MSFHRITQKQEKEKGGTLQISEFSGYSFPENKYVYPMSAVGGQPCVSSRKPV